MCGSFGDISTFSFYANKSITTGEGGMLLTDDKKIYNVHQSGQTIDYNVTASGGKFYLNSVEKPILNLKIGVTYRFLIDSSILSSHPFYLTTSTVAWAAASNSIHSGSEVTTNSNSSINTNINLMHKVIVNECINRVDYKSRVLLSPQDGIYGASSYCVDYLHHYHLYHYHFFYHLYYHYFNWKSIQSCLSTST